jgi:hypothetical protein
MQFRSERQDNDIAFWTPVVLKTKKEMGEILEKQG